MSEERACKVCGVVLVRREYERTDNFKVRKTCGTECTNASRRFDRDNDPIRHCVSCGDRLVRGEKESLFHFNLRQSCSRKCFANVCAGRRQTPRDIKSCIVCDTTFERKTSENATKWENRKFCSPACRNAFNKTKIEATKHVLEPRVCEVCGITFDPPVGITTDGWKIRKTCSQECRYQMVRVARAVDLPPKDCLICGSQFERRDDEQSTLFRLRETCSHSCARTLAGQRHSDTDMPRTSLYPREFWGMRKVILERDEHTCRLCGVMEGSPHVHHINYNKDDCSELNLITLCRSCHMQTNWNRDYWQGMLSATMETRWWEAA